MTGRETAGILAICVIVVLRVADLLALYGTRDPRLKRRYVKMVGVASALALPPFWFVAWRRSQDTIPLLVFALLTPVAIFLRLKAYKFCPRCGATNRNPMLGLQAMRFCQECGAPLGHEHEHRRQGHGD